MESTFMKEFFTEIATIRVMMQEYCPERYNQIYNKLVDIEKMSVDGYDKAELQIRSNMISILHRRLEELQSRSD
jgi:hypothetical protein